MEIKFFSLSKLYAHQQLAVPLKVIEKKVVLLAMMVLSTASILVYFLFNGRQFKAKKIPVQKNEIQIKKTALQRLPSSSLIEPLCDNEQDPFQISYPFVKESLLTPKQPIFLEDGVILKAKPTEVDTSVISPTQNKKFPSDVADKTIATVENFVENSLNKKDLNIPSAHFEEVNEALKILFKMAIDEQWGKNQKNKQRMIDALTVFEKEQDKFVHAQKVGILTLGMSFLSYLTREIPEEVQKLSYLHNESLILTALEEKISPEISFSKVLIKLACCAVSRKFDEGFYYLLRPSTFLPGTLRSDAIYSITFRQENALMPDNTWHERLELIIDPVTQACLFRKQGSVEKGVPIDDFIAKMSLDLPLFPISAPLTSEERIETYFHNS